MINRRDNGPANIAILRSRTLDIARRDTSRGSLSFKQPYLGSLFKRLSSDERWCSKPLHPSIKRMLADTQTLGNISNGVASFRYLLDHINLKVVGKFWMCH
jgi:hypothetical protein